MKTINININRLDEVINELNTKLGGELKSKSGEYVMDIDNDLAKGTIKGICYKEGLSYLEYDLKFYEDVKIYMKSSKTNPILFMYCSNGTLTHNFLSNKAKRSLKQFQTAIVSAGRTETHELFFAKNVYTTLTIIHVEKNINGEYNNFTMLNKQLQELFASEKTDKNFAYFGTYNLQVYEQISQLKDIQAEGFSRIFQIQGIIYLILALEIQQHLFDTKNQEENLGSLTRFEMSKIKELSEMIKEHPEEQYTIKSLCGESGLSPAKLQEGFKLMHGRTVTDYIRNIRVEVSEELIKTTDMNISEVVYSVGLTSRSYFSKIFKEKYNCSPREYQNQKKMLAATA
ncbi:helix-turn-helix domain-containing protein [Abyssalbus ytuae]|uniref:AraC family transcriptional regulator n=1 Tax=Abyssalbus ytuae TaxID=2926907 RepID=A0A9E6ZMD0_9FLAO|nr:AraC family transcriptional regulator [Abyssalbus ytuae]UOB16955.1 AraC family transcriptional regulator [Abyssalbus ytuae]